MKMDGYVVVPPVNSWDDKEAVWLDTGYRSFGKTSIEAWIRFTGYTYDDPDRSIKIQRWHDGGYRLKKATLEITDD
jgi:hypothetical protein